MGRGAKSAGYWSGGEAGSAGVPPASSDASEITENAPASFLDAGLKQADRAVSRTERQIELLSEYRTRLIADVVTGKLDVCEAAAALPEVDPLAAEDTLNDPLDVDAV